MWGAEAVGAEPFCVIGDAFSKKNLKKSNGRFLTDALRKAIVLLVGWNPRKFKASTGLRKSKLKILHGSPLQGIAY